MKKCALFCIFTMLAVTIITSCMGESGQIVSMANQPGVVIKTPDSTKIQTRDITLYSDRYTASADDGDCFILQYNIDFGLFANADTGRRTGLYTVEILNMEAVPMPDLETTLVDTATVFTNEQTISLQKRYSIIRNRLFLYTQINPDTVLPVNTFSLSYTTEAAPATSDGNKKIYDLFLRSTKEPSNGTTIDLSKKIYLNAFNIYDLLSKKGSDDTLFFRINYVNSFNKDSTAITHWSSELFTYPADITYAEQK